MMTFVERTEYFPMSFPARRFSLILLQIAAVFTTQPPGKKCLFFEEVCEGASPRAPSSLFPRASSLRSSPWQRVNPDVCTGSSALAPACRVPRCLVSCQRRPTAGQGGGLWGWHDQRAGPCWTGQPSASRTDRHVAVISP